MSFSVKSPVLLMVIWHGSVADVRLSQVRSTFVHRELEVFQAVAFGVGDVPGDRVGGGVDIEADDGFDEVGDGGDAAPADELGPCRRRRAYLARGFL